MSTRTIVTTFLSIAAFVGIYNFYSCSAASTTNMAADLSSLQWSLEQISASPPTLRAHLKNTSPTPFTMLKWNTPIDTGALNLAGVFRFVNADTNEEIQRPVIAVSRMMPPPENSFVEIPAHGEIMQDFELSKDWVPKKFKVSATGRWNAVWPAMKSEVSQQQMDKAVGDLSGEFSVPEATFDLSTGLGEA